MGVLPGPAGRRAIDWSALADSFRDSTGLGFAMKGSASADFSAMAAASQHEGIVALVRWRLLDPSWKPSFADLLDDARACIGPAVDRSDLLQALREAIMIDASVAPVARRLAVEAGLAMAPPSPAVPVKPGRLGSFLARWSASGRRAAAVAAADQLRSGDAASRIRN
jgi:hypothetical protein